MDNQDKVKASLLGLDNLIEDLFGLNAKAFKSIWISFRSPKTYALAAKTPNWSEAFTPTVRVWFGLIALYSAFRFFYGSEDGAMTQMYVEMFDTLIARDSDSLLTEFDTTALAQSLLKWTFVFFPFIMLLLYALMALVFRVWPDKPGFVVRFRYILLAVIPSTALTALFTLLIVILPVAWLPVILAINFIGVFLLDGLTAYRGPLHSLDKKNRRGLSFVMTVLLNIFIYTGSFIAAIPAMTAAIIELSP